MNKNSIVAWIAKASPEELDYVRPFLDATRKGGIGVKVKKVEEDVSDDWLLRGIGLYLKKRGLLVGHNEVAVLARTKGYQAYKKKRSDLVNYLDRLEYQSSTKTRHRPKLAFMLARALADHLESMNVFMVGTMLSQIDRIPEAVNRAYPGYLQSGLFRILIDSIEELEKETK